MYMYMYMYIYVCKYVCVYIAREAMHAAPSIHVCLNACTHMYVCIHAYIQREAAKYTIQIHTQICLCT